MGHSHRTTQAMSEEQLKAAKAAEAEATAEQVEDSVEEISEEDLAGVAGGNAVLASGGQKDEIRYLS